MTNIRELQELLKTLPKKRTETQVDKLVQLTSELFFFSRLSEVAHYQCCKAMTLLRTSTGTQIFALGAQSDAFYIVLKGSVSVFIPRKKRTDEPPDHGTSDPTNKQSSADSYKETVLGAGASFGELGLISSIPRTASVISKEKSVLAVLAKDDFDTIILATEKSRLALLVAYLQSFKIFSNWTKAALSKASYAFSSKYFSLNELVYKEMTPASYVYFILEGEFKLIKTVVSTQTRTIIDSLYGPRPKSSFKESIRKTFHLKNDRKVSRLQLVIKGSGEVLGETEVSEGGNYHTSCFCMSRGSHVLVISKDVRFYSGFFEAY